MHRTDFWGVFMFRFVALAFLSLSLLAACGGTTSTPTLGADGKPLPQVYRIKAGSTGTIQFRMLDAVNVLRQAGSVTPVKLNSQLNAAAATHARDMSVQNRAWHFGSDGSSPIERVARTGYPGILIGETISETFETELETLSAWMAQSNTRDVIMDPRATDLGFRWFQEPNGKIWWALVLGGASANAS